MGLTRGIQGPQECSGAYRPLRLAGIVSSPLHSQVGLRRFAPRIREHLYRQRLLPPYEGRDCFPGPYPQPRSRHARLMRSDSGRLFRSG